MAPGKGLLKVCGILLIIFAGIGAVIGLLSILGMSAIESNPEALELLEQAGEPYNAQQILINGIMSVVIGVIEVVVGIMCVINCNRTDKAQVCLLAGIVALVCELGSSVYAAVTTRFTVSSVLTMVVALVLPILIIWGALKNKETNNG
jgi:hypothetical protein